VLPTHLTGFKESDRSEGKDYGGVTGEYGVLLFFPIPGSWGKDAPGWRNATKIIYPQSIFVDHFTVSGDMLDRNPLVIRMIF